MKNEARYFFPKISLDKIFRAWQRLEEESLRWQLGQAVVAWDIWDFLPTLLLSCCLLTWGKLPLLCVPANPSAKWRE